MAIDATVGGASANSYATIAEADAYFATRTPSTSWDAATEPEKDAALQSAARRVDQERFVGHTVKPINGTSSEPTQALAFPRYSLVSREGWVYLHTVIPEGVKRAQFEIAYALLDGSLTLADLGLEGFDRAKIGPLEVDIRHQRKAGTLPQAARRELDEFLRTTGASVIMERA